ncbi:MAG: multicopper oxidase domain-containing protein, partial [Longimicrobiales bacterium]
GTYYYAGKTTSDTVFGRREFDSQLNGVIIVDPAGATAAPTDRVFLISWWIDEDPTEPSGLAGGTLVINGLSWPHTERFEVTQGDSLYWRWVSVTQPPHPMHLHGFYFRVDAKGDGVRDTIYAPEQRRLAVTEVLTRGQTMSIVWSPERPGNWIFHCHIATHMSTFAQIRQMAAVPGVVHVAHGANDAAHDHAMARLVLGIRVQPRGDVVNTSAAARPIRLLIRSQRATTGRYARYAYVLGGSPEEADATALPKPGPTLILEKDQPVAVTIVNQSHEPAAVHWHGIELESFPDGVPGWSGHDRNLLPAIAPRDSLVVRFTPSRAGTFMYHSHFNELQQIALGLYGAIVVLERGQRFDPATDRVLLFSDAGPTPNPVTGPFANALLNGQAQPQTMTLHAGTTYRFRLINIRSVFPVVVALLDGERPVAWRHVAKDGAELPPAQTRSGPAQLLTSPGEIHDFEYTPLVPGELTLQFGLPRAMRPLEIPMPAPVRVPVRVR